MQAPSTEATAKNVNGRPRGLVASVISDAQRLVTLEIALAKQELKDLAMRNGIAAGLIAFGGLLIVLGVLVAVPVLVVMLVPWKWQAAAVWVAAYVLIGLLLALVGKSRLQMRLPERTIETLKENTEWALRRVRSNGK